MHTGSGAGKEIHTVNTHCQYTLSVNTHCQYTLSKIKIDLLGKNRHALKSRTHWSHAQSINRSATCCKSSPKSMQGGATYKQFQRQECFSILTTWHLQRRFQHSGAVRFHVWICSFVLKLASVHTNFLFNLYSTYEHQSACVKKEQVFDRPSCVKIRVWKSGSTSTTFL